MGKSKYMTGTPWHVEKFTRQEDDPRRHRSRCIHYDSDSKHCSYRCGQCVGSAHCSHYKEKVVATVNPTPQEKPTVSMEFAGVKEIPMSQVVIDYSKAKEPTKSKVDGLVAYYRKNGSLDKPIIVSVQGDKYQLEDKYLRYYVAKKLGLKSIPAKIGTFRESKAEDKLRKVGTKVRHQKFGNGTVVEATLTHTTIRFENEKEMKFDISMCLEKKYLTFQ